MRDYAPLMMLFIVCWHPQFRWLLFASVWCAGISFIWSASCRIKVMRVLILEDYGRFSHQMGIMLSYWCCLAIVYLWGKWFRSFLVVWCRYCMIWKWYWFALFSQNLFFFTEEGFIYELYISVSLGLDHRHVENDIQDKGCLCSTKKKFTVWI